jgi:phosphopantetheine adenylyltransferase
VVFAIAHVRGGGELGRRWYEDGKFLAKPNTFSDFVACADHLVSAGHRARDRLAIRGGSAGGLLIGATLNLRPDLCAAAVAEVPFVDVVTTMSDPSIPLTVIEYDEWGNPEDPAYLEVMRSYSPYDNVRAVDYPAMFVTAGLNDPRVQYWEPAKWVAKLRTTATGGGPIVLKTELGAGHAGRSGRYDAWRDEAEVLAFVLADRGRGRRPAGGPGRAGTRSRPDAHRRGRREGPPAGRAQGHRRAPDLRPGQGGAVLLAAAGPARARVLDLFAGSGALGLEALSRGAASVTFVERSRPRSGRPAPQHRGGGAARRHVVAGEAAVALRGELPGAPFDLVLLDPPYHHPKAALAALLDGPGPAPGPRRAVVLERAARTAPRRGRRPCCPAPPAATVTRRCTSRSSATEDRARSGAMSVAVVCPGSFDPITLRPPRRHRAGRGALRPRGRRRAREPPQVGAVHRRGAHGDDRGGDGHLDNVEVDRFQGLLVDFCRARGIGIVCKGLRAVSDFEYELQMAQMNQRIGGVETVFLSTSPEHSYLSSSLVKEVARFGGPIDGTVPPAVADALRARLGAGRDRSCSPRPHTPAGSSPVGPAGRLAPVPRRPSGRTRRGSRRIPWPARPDERLEPPMSDPGVPPDVEAKLHQLERLIAEAKAVPLSASVMVNRAEIDGLLDDLREALPDELTQAHWVLTERDEILERAQGDADHARSTTREERDRLVSEQEVVRTAEREADALLEDAREHARQIRLEAEDYVDAKLANFEVVLTKTLATVEKGRRSCVAGSTPTCHARRRGPATSTRTPPGPRPAPARVVRALWTVAPARPRPGRLWYGAARSDPDRAGDRPRAARRPAPTVRPRAAAPLRRPRRGVLPCASP